MKEVLLSEIERRTMACALSLFMDAVKNTEINNEDITTLSKAVALISCTKIIQAFDLEKFMEEFEAVQQ